MTNTQAIEALEEQLSNIHPEAFSPDVAEAMKAEKHEIMHRLERLKLEEAQSWSKSDWLTMIEKLIDDIGHYVDRLFSYNKR